MTAGEISQYLLDTLGLQQLPDVDLKSTPHALTIVSSDLINVMQVLRDDPNMFFDHLSCVTGLDNGPVKNTMEVIYHLFSIPFDHAVTVKVILDRTQPEIASVSELWKTANWHEREAFDLLGIRFTNHPDLRRILLPEDWEGHPLRKDYQEQDKYHGITVKY